MMVDESKLARAFTDVFGIDPLNHEGTFSLEQVKEFADKLGLQVCLDVTRAAPGRMPTQPERKRNKEFLARWLPTAVKLMADQPKAAELLKDGKGWDDAPISVGRRETISQAAEVVLVNMLSPRDREAVDVVRIADCVAYDVLMIPGFFAATRDSRVRVLQRSIERGVGRNYHDTTLWPGSNPLAEAMCIKLDAMEVTGCLNI